MNTARAILPASRFAARIVALVFLSNLFTVLEGVATEPAVAPLPPGVKAVWAPGKAFRQTTATRQRICLNGLWQWQPAMAPRDKLPVENWGWFKVPGSWPGITDYMQKDSQTVWAHPSWKSLALHSVSAAWYQREFTVPNDWIGRRVAIRAEYLNSFAAAYIDGHRVGELHFPGGELEITAACRPGATHQLTVLVVAMPLKGCN
jgi:hypothetical protein